MCCAVVWTPAAHIQLQTQPQTQKGPYTVENLMRGPGTQEGAPQSCNEWIKHLYVSQPFFKAEFARTAEASY